MSDYNSRYGAKRKAMSKRNWIRWIVCWSIFSTYLFLPFPFPMIVSFTSIGIVFILNRRDLNKTHNEILNDIEKRFAKTNSAFGIEKENK
jgi:hypothetical protein